MAIVINRSETVRPLSPMLWTDYDHLHIKRISKNALPLRILLQIIILPTFCYYKVLKVVPHEFLNHIWTTPVSFDLRSQFFLSGPKFNEFISSSTQIFKSYMICIIRLRNHFWIKKVFTVKRVLELFLAWNYFENVHSWKGLKIDL